ncbi:MAG: hypothetical protein Q8P21_02640 [bacterium]|nr:hypothetical protein [bacterium]
MKWNLGPVKVFVLTALLATLIPAIFTVKEAGGWQGWQGVPPKGTADSLYYYARIHEVADGYPLNGNPYVYEYRGTLSPAFFLPDIVSAVPLLLGVPFNITVMINVFAWSLVFLILSFTLLRQLSLPSGWATLWSFFLYMSVYSFMLRPVGMQIAYPVFLAFLIAFLKFLDEPLRRYRVVWLSLSTALTFYVYTYLSYIAILAFVFIFFWFLLGRRFRELRMLVTAGVFTALLLIPFGVFTLMQMSNPFYLETFRRIGLVFTRIPSIEAFYFGRWVLVGMLLAWLVPLKQKIFWLSTGAALLVCLFLNVLTGVELTLAVHIGRFVILWMVIIFAVGLYEWYSARNLVVSKTKYIVAALLLVLLAVGVMRNTSRRLGFFDFNRHPGYDFADTQLYAAPLKWLEENVPEQSVIWANDSIAQYVPIMTKHYPLFSSGAVLHNISQQELEDRFLVSRSLYPLTVEDLKRDFGIYSGAGPSKEEPRAENQRAWLCEVIARFGSTRQCPARTDAVAIRGEEFFQKLAERFQVIKQNQAARLAQFNVSYLIIDRAHDNLAPISANKALYDDGRFVILSLPLR